MQLRRADVVAGALTLLDSDGLDGLTMRKVAAHLGVQAGALYWHFANKQALLDAMAQSLVSDAWPATVAGAWDEQLTRMGHRLREALLAHRDGARVMAGSYTSDPTAATLFTAVVDVLCDAGIPPERAGWIMFALQHYVLGHTIEEQAQAEVAAAQAEAERLATAPDRSNTARAITALATADPAERFGYGLALFLDGVRRQLPGEPGATRSPS
jgi:TetR/AcrR family transcriptional regulator, tetracycline repressor protein